MQNRRDGTEWYALQLRPRLEKVVATHLQHKGYEEYLPTYRSRRCWSDRVKELDYPLFPGYIFCKFDLRNRLPILVIPGVISIVSIGRMPMPISEAEIHSIQRVVTSGLPYGPLASLCTGQRVRVERGPLRGLEGVVLELRSTYQLVVSVPLLSRSVSVAIDRDSVVPVRANASRVPTLEAHL
jgi:transcription antitermination factor NusG